MSAIPYLVDNDYPWLRFIAACGEEGARWAAEYRQPEIGELYDSIIGSLKLMGKAKLPEALAVLAAADERIATLEGRYSPSVVRVIECWYHGALAYYHYCREDYGQAEAILIRGHEAISRGVETQRIILPMVYRCCDTWLHRSRIARSRHDWTAMRQHLDTFCAIHRGELPFCTLADGTSIYAADLENYLARLDLPDEDLRHYAGVFAVAENRRDYSDYYAEAIYLLPWMPLHY